MSTHSNPISIQLFEALNEIKIEYAVLRNYKTLPQNLGGSDLDLWVSNKNYTAFLEVLRNISQNTDAPLVSYIASKECPKICLLNENHGIQIDVFKGNIPYKTEILIDEETIKANLEKYNEIFILNDQLADLIAFIKEIINNGCAAEKYITPLYKNAEKYTEEDLNHNLAKVGKEFSSLLYQTIIKRQVESSQKQLAEVAQKSFRKRSSFLQTLQKFSRLRHSPGYVMAVLGTDGSGKSTIINAITPWLDEAFHKGVFYHHLRPTLLPDLGIILGKKTAKEKPIVVSDPHRMKPSGLFVSMIRWGYYLQDYIFGYLKKVWPQSSFKSKIFIFDRYYYDYYIDQRRFRTSIPKWVLKLGDFFVPKPDLILCLGGDPQKIYERKPETSLEEVKRQTEALREFCNSRKNSVWIDTTLQPEESISHAKRAILKMMEKRFEKVNF